MRNCAASSAIFLCLWAPASPAAAHSAGPLDGHGCHQDRRAGDYHCHVGNYKDVSFKSKSEMLTYKKNGTTKDQILIEQRGGIGAGGLPEAPPELEEEGWASWVPFSGRSDNSAQGGGEGGVIIPRGLQERLSVLKKLHEQGLITDEDYDTKRKEILGEL